MKILIRSALVVVVLLVLTVIVFWTPDTSREQMESQYGGSSSRFIDMSNGDRLHYRDEGVRSGPNLVLIHGFSASLHTWEPLIAELRDDYRLISIDMPGHGLTGANQARDYSRDAMANAVFTVMDHLRVNQATLVGNSMGGAVAWHAALKASDRVKSLVLLAPAGAPRRGEAKSNIGFKLLGTSVGKAMMKNITPRAIIKKSLQQSVFDSTLVTDDMVDRYWNLLRLEGNRQAVLDMSSASRDPDAWTRVKELDLPVLIIWGRQDNVLPVSMADEFESMLPNAKVIRLDNVGHLPMEEAVTTVATLIEENVK